MQGPMMPPESCLHDSWVVAEQRSLETLKSLPSTPRTLTRRFMVRAQIAACYKPDEDEGISSRWRGYRVW